MIFFRFFLCLGLLVAEMISITASTKLSYEHTIPDRQTSTQLMEASMKGDTFMVETLLNDANTLESLNVRGGKSGSTALIMASAQGHVDVIRLLIAAGASFAAVNNLGLTALMGSAHGGHITAAQLLVNAGADLETAGGKYSWTPLMWASYANHMSVVEYFLDQGARVDVRDNLGRTPLIGASSRGNTATVDLLLQRGADIEGRDDGGWTALAWACHHGQPVIVKQLLDAGANIESKSEDGRTPIMPAVTQGHLDIIELLLKAGVDVTVVDSEGKSVIDWAQDNEKHTKDEIINYLGCFPTCENNLRKIDISVGEL